MYSSRKAIVLALMLAGTVGMAAAIEIQDSGSFPTGTDYEKEKEKQGNDLTNYKKTYHKEIPGGSEHAEVVVSNGPDSNSWSQTYSKHQSFGSSDIQQSRSFSSTNGSAISAEEHAKKIEETKARASAISEGIKNSIAKAQKDAMDRHNAIMKSIQQSMAINMAGIGGIGTPFVSLEAEPKTVYINPFDGWMRNHRRMMNLIMKQQNEQMQTLRQLITSSSYPRRSASYYFINTSEMKQKNSRAVDGEAVVSRSLRASGKKRNSD